MKLLIGTTEVGGSDNPCPSVSISKECRYHPTTGQVYAETETWRVSGVLLKKSSTLKSHKDTLETLIESVSGSETVKLQKSGADVHILNGGASEAIGGLQVSSVSYPNESPIEYGNILSYEFEISLTSAVQTEWGVYDLNISENEQGVISRSGQGTYYTQTVTDSLKEDCKSWLEGELPNSDFETDLSFQVTEQRDSDSGASGLHEVSFTFGEAAGVYKPFSNVVGLEISCSIRAVANDIDTATIRGSVTGKVTDSSNPRDSAAQNAKNAYDSIIANPSDYVTGVDNLVLNPSNLRSWEKEVDDVSGTISFSLEYIITQKDIAKMDEKMTVESGFQDYVLRSVLDGSDPIKQYTVQRPARASQKGTMISVRKENPPRPYWADPKNPKVTYQLIHKTYDDRRATHWRMTWSYEWEFERTPSL